MSTATELGVDSVLDIVNELFEIEGNERGDEFDMHCPSPAHNDSKPSCSVNLTSGLWKCLGCGASGDLAKLGCLALNKSREELIELLKPNTPEAILASVQRKVSSLGLVRERRTKLVLPGPYESGPHNYLRSRGFTNETIKKWGIRYVHEERLEGKKKSFIIQHCIAIPILASSGELLAWCYRSTPASPSWQPRYMYTKDVDIKELWFGLQHNQDTESIVVVEGALDAIWLDQCGIPAWGLLGASMTSRKISQLQTFGRATTLLDRDSGGILANYKIGQIVGHQMPLRVARYPKWSDAKDPQSLHPVDLEIVLARSETWMSWISRQKLFKISA